MPTTPVRAIEKWKEHVTKNDPWVKDVIEKPRTPSQNKA